MRPRSSSRRSGRCRSTSSTARRRCTHERRASCSKSGRAPIYLVHFTQKDATEAAQNYLSLDPLTKDGEGRGSGRRSAGSASTRRSARTSDAFITAGVGVHHAGLLPKYRLLVEKLAQDGLLKIICGTDTLGVGVNVPIRSVLFTQLCKYDGTRVRILSQPRVRPDRRTCRSQGLRRPRRRVGAGARARRREPASPSEKAAEKGRKKVVKKKAARPRLRPLDRGHVRQAGRRRARAAAVALPGQPPDGDELLDRPVEYVEASRSRRRTDRRVPRCAGADRQPRDPQAPARPHPPGDRDLPLAGRRRDARVPRRARRAGATVRVNFDLQDEFALHQPLSLWAVEAIGRLDTAEAARVRC